MRVQRRQHFQRAMNRHPITGRPPKFHVSFFAVRFAVFRRNAQPKEGSHALKMGATEFPDRSRAIAFHSDLVRRSRASGDITTARGAYAALVESWKQQNVNCNGALQRELDAVRHEYSEFVRTDPLYQAIRDAAVEVIRRQPETCRRKCIRFSQRSPRRTFSMRYILPRIMVS